MKTLPQKKKYVYCLRTVNLDGTAYKGFKWPASGYVEAPDFPPTVKCGKGLHGYLRGEGDAQSIIWDGLFQVVKVLEKEIIDLDGKVKFPRCEVVFTGDKKTATDILVKKYPAAAVIGASKIVGDREVAVVGDRGIATAGSNGMAMAGENGVATVIDAGRTVAGIGGTATSTSHGTSIAGTYGTAMTGAYGTAIAGTYGTAIAGCNGKATAGYCGVAIAGKCGVAKVDRCGTAMAGHCGKVIAGEDSKISLIYWDGKRERETIGYVGEDGIEPNVAYILDVNNKFVKA